jgi:gliding motility-associated protein GldM
MSIPKEPRQLMINLMYLVLTALLALNVSAEIFNAFKLVDDGLIKSNATLETTNQQIPDRVRELARKSEDKYMIYADNADKARKISAEFIEYVEGIKNYMVEETGGWDDEKGQPKGYKDKDITTRFLVGKDPSANAGEAGKLERKIEETAAAFLALVDEGDRATFAPKITLVVDDAFTRSKDKKNWGHYNFFQMPLLAVMPILSKIENDCRSTEAALLNYFLGKAGGESIEFDSYKIVSSPKRSYIIAGETYETEIFLAASSSNPGSVAITVNGSPVRVENGVAKYTAGTSETGVKSYTAKAVITNPVTGETETVESRFEYEVGRRSATIQLDKMNVFYIGVENPISVSAAGVSSNDLKVTGSGAGIQLRNTGPGKYIVTATQPGEATITLTGGGLAATSFSYRVKRIPDPSAKVARLKGGQLSPGEIKVQPGMIAELEGFDFDAKCSIESFRMIRTRRGDDPALVNNTGAAFGPQAKQILNDARPGDQYLFTDVKGKCPGDAASRNLNTLVFTIR